MHIEILTEKQKELLPYKKIAEEAKKLYEDMFSEKLFREQLAFHKDIDYSESVDYMNGYEENADKIKAFLIEKALEW